MFPRWRIHLVLFGVVSALFAGCASNYPPTAIIGTWQTGIRDKKSTMTFWENGVWTFESRNKSERGTFKFVSDNQLEIKLDPIGDENPPVYRRIVSFAHHDQLHLTDADTYMRTTWKRIEQQ